MQKKFLTTLGPIQALIDIILVLLIFHKISSSHVPKPTPLSEFQGKLSQGFPSSTPVPSNFIGSLFFVNPQQLKN